MNRETRRALVLQKDRDGKGVMDISRELGISKQTVSDIIKCFKGQASIKDKPRSGRPRTARTPAKVKIIRERIRRNPKRSMRKMRRDLKIDERSGLKPIKFQAAHVLTDAMKAQRLAKCRSLLKKLAGGTHRAVLWSDEAPFSIEQEFNKQKRSDFIEKRCSCKFARSNRPKIGSSKVCDGLGRDHC